MSTPTPLRVERVRKLLPGHRFTRDLRLLGLVTSTSDLLVQEARKGAEDGLVLVAEGQLRGRGRRGSSWSCPPGAGLLLSILLRQLPAAPLRPLLSAASGIALARAIETCKVPARLKWPNDVVCQGRKLAGVIVDLEADFAVIGLGVNVNQGPHELPVEAPLPAASLRLLTGELVSRESLLVAILRELARHLQLLQDGDLDELTRAWTELDALPGVRVSAREGDRIIEGLVLSTHPRDGLLLRLDDHSKVRLRAEHTHLLAVQFPHEEA